MDQRELLELARAAMQKKRSKGGGRRGAAQAVAQAARDEDEGVGPESRTSDVDSALARIAAVDARIEQMSHHEADDDVRRAEAQATRSGAVESADARLAALDRHIQDEHEFKAYDPSQSAAPTDGRFRRSLRDAFLFQMLLGPPKSQE